MFVDSRTSKNKVNYLVSILFILFCNTVLAQEVKPQPPKAQVSAETPLTLKDLYEALETQEKEIKKFEFQIQKYQLQHGTITAGAMLLMAPTWYATIDHFVELCKAVRTVENCFEAGQKKSQVAVNWKKVQGHLIWGSIYMIISKVAYKFADDHAKALLFDDADMIALRTEIDIAKIKVSILKEQISLADGKQTIVSNPGKDIPESTLKDREKLLLQIRHEEIMTDEYNKEIRFRKSIKGVVALATFAVSFAPYGFVKATIQDIKIMLDPLADVKVREEFLLKNTRSQIKILSRATSNLSIAAVKMSSLMLVEGVLTLIAFSEGWEAILGDDQTKELSKKVEESQAQLKKLKTSLAELY